MSFDVIQLEQGTLAWRKWRSCGIGASDAPAFMGENPWKSPDQILEQKLTFDLTEYTNEAMRRGTALEPLARDAYCSRINQIVKPACVQSKKYPWMRASIDGINIDTKDIVEIKCGDSTYNNIVKYRQIPRHYIGQLQFILSVTGFDSIDFWCYSQRKNPILAKIRRDDEYIDRLMKVLLDFWRKLEPDVIKYNGDSAFN